MTHLHTGICHIFGAGDFDLTSLAVGDTDYVICADAGYFHAKECKVSPHVVLGDFDSAGLALKNALQKKLDKTKIIVLPEQKDDTDMLYGIKYGLEKGYRSFRLYGALGGRRMDHTIANLQCLLFLKEKGAYGEIIEKNRRILVVHKERPFCFDEQEDGNVGVFSMEKVSSGVTISGLSYELHDGKLTYDFPIGVSNSFCGKAGSIRVENGTLLVILDRTEKK